jgi:non-ribosomal peptide synthetase component F
VQSLNIAADLLEALRELSNRQQVTLFMLLLAALVTLLHRYTGKNDFAISTPLANRHRPETAEVIGRFTDNIVLRIRLTDVETFSDLLHRVRSVVSEAFEHQDLPFDLFPGNTPEAWQNLDYPTLGFNMLANTEGIVQEAREDTEVAHMPRLRVEMMSLPQHRRESTKTMGIYLIVLEEKADLYMNFAYECERYEHSAIKELLGNYRLILETVITGPERRLLDFPLMTPTAL